MHLLRPRPSPHRRRRLPGRPIRRTPLPDALVCFNDELGIAIRRLHELGCRVPGELAVIGIDGIKEAEFVTPSLSTIAPDKTALAARAIGEQRCATSAGHGNR